MRLLHRVDTHYQRLMQTPLGRSVHRYQHFRGSRLAGSVTFYGFLSIFPLLVLAFAVTLRFLGSEAVTQFEETVDGYIPGISDDLALPQLRSQASQLGLLGAASLAVTGLGWVDAQRASVRSMWGMPDRDENLFIRKIKDAVALVGLGGLVLISFLSTSVVGGLAERTLRLFGVDEGAALDLGLRAASAALAITTAVALMAYLLAGLPRIRMRVRVLLVGALVGGLAFEGGKQLLVGYISNVAANNTYGAFGVPVALAVWIYVMARLVMAVAAWTAEVSGASWVQPRFSEDMLQPDGRPVALSASLFGRQLATAAVVGAAVDEPAAVPGPGVVPVALSEDTAAGTRGGAERRRGLAQGIVVGMVTAGALWWLRAIVRRR
jgi:membrane protein